jgi:hypothetical protein
MMCCLVAVGFDRLIDRSFVSDGCGKREVAMVALMMMASGKQRCESDGSTEGDS